MRRFFSSLFGTGGARPYPALLAASPSPRRPAIRRLARSESIVALFAPWPHHTEVFLVLCTDPEKPEPTAAGSGSSSSSSDGSGRGRDGRRDQGDGDDVATQQQQQQRAHPRPVGPVLVDAPRLDGGTQGLAWEQSTLHRDEDGDLAHGFLVADLPSKPAPS